jgi:hypothetical protein
LETRAAGPLFAGNFGMASTVTTRPNHYQLLGIEPGASGGEIDSAFVKAIAAPRAFGGLAEIGVAYETLRDAARRRAYDDSIGLNAPPPPPAPQPDQHKWQFSAPQTTARPRPEAAAEPRLSSFIAASLRPSRDPEPRADTVPQAPVAAQPLRRPVLPIAPAEPAAKIDAQPVDWKRMGIAVAGAVGVVALIGAWAGWQAGSDVESASVTVAVPSATSPPAPTAKPAAERVAEPARPIAFAAPAAPAARATPAPLPLEPERPPQTVASGPFEQVAEAGAPQSAAALAEVPAESAVASTTASLPLSNATIAQTIRRIGYACGSVASASAIDGHAGTFKITCSSGDSYRASQVRGRYHFKRLGSH